MVVRMVRTKVLAILLGPAGIGLEAIFDSVLTLVRTLFDLGISSSGVRQIASAESSGDPQRIARTVFTLRRTCLVLGALGAVSLLLGREWASRAAFDDANHATAIGWLAIALFFANVNAGQGALLQGLRRVGDLARMKIIGAIAGAAASIPIVMVWGRGGVPAYMIVGAGMALLVSWYYTRKVAVAKVAMPASIVISEARGLFALGIAFMVSGLIASGAAFLLRALITREFGLEGAGQFQAASALSMVYIGFILQAMGTDFYPRLTAVAADDEKCNRTVNEQAEVSLLLALPGILGTLALAPWVIKLFYSGDFSLATDILSWQMCGMLLRIMSWPMGFIVMAKGRGAMVFWTELAAFGTYLAMAWSGLQWFGLMGAGIAFFGMYVFHVTMMYTVVRRMTGFRWDSQYLGFATVGLSAALFVLWVRLEWPEPWATLVPCTLSAAASLYSLKKLLAIVGFERMQRIAGKLKLSWVLEALR